MAVAWNDSSLEAPPEDGGVDFARGLLVEPRVLRRVIRLDRRLGGFGFHVPHASNYVIERARLLAYTELEELGLPPTAELPRDVILLAKPTDEELRRGLSPALQAARRRRELLHAHVHLQLERKLAQLDAPEALVDQRRRQIGAVAFDEIRTVLLKDGLLFAESNDVEAYVEFLATYFELRYFAPDQLAGYFPAIRDWAALERLADLDVHHASLFEIVQTALADEEAGPSASLTQTAAFSSASETSAARRLHTRNLPARARRAASVGNGVKAAILWTRNAEAAAVEGQPAPLPAAALRELQQVVSRLQRVLLLSDADARSWRAALEPLLAPAASGGWTTEARLLYDLQKVCVEQERGVYRYDLFRWARSLGAQPLRQPLPLLRGVLITKHLRSATRRLALARLSTVERERLSAVLAAASEQAELRVRETLRPLVAKVLDEVGIVPVNLPERVARANVVEELLDVIVEQGAANLGHLRDAISRNDIKLPDVAGAGELLRGDRLLRADRLLAHELAGVYRPGAIYLRSAQRLSSLAFGTRTGRFLTQYVALPYGGAFLILEGLRHMWGYAAGGHAGSSAAEQTLAAGAAAAAELPIVAAAAAPSATSGSVQSAAVAAAGTFLLLLLHSVRFRHWVQTQVHAVWTVVKTAVVDLPSRIVFSPVVQNFLRGPTYAALRSYVIWPGIVTCAAAAVASWNGSPLSGHLKIELFLATALFLNSRVGRFVDEWIGDVLLRLWQELRMRVFTALFDWIMDAFHRLFAYLERIVYTVDEWLRFRAGDNRYMQVVKALSGACWFFVSYLLVLVFTLLIEPQVNPIKHFPVVTVSHKLLLPAGPAFVEQLDRLTGIGKPQANTIVWSTIWLIPGVFGFLVWELKENWRLYAANRPDQLTATRIGRHGETMVRLLRPGFHSGVVPKQFAGLRAAFRALQEGGDQKAVERKLAALRRIEQEVARFVDRQLLLLWKQSARTASLDLAVRDVRLATTRIEVDLEVDRDAQRVLALTWDEQRGRLVASAAAGDWAQRLEPGIREAGAVALTGLFQRSCAETFQLEPAFPPQQRLTWAEWAAYWSR